MILYIHGRSSALALTLSILTTLSCRTASEMKIRQAQSTTSTHARNSNQAQQPQATDAPDMLTGYEAFKLAVGFDLFAGTADEAADRALSTVGRKLDKTLSVEFTVNELISEATDVSNLANMFFGACAQGPSGFTPANDLCKR